MVSGAGIVLNSRLNMSGRSGGGGICGGRGGYVCGKVCLWIVVNIMVSVA